MFLLFNPRLIHHSFHCSSAKNNFACSIHQLKFSVVKILQYTVLACSYSYPAITIWKASSKVKKLDRDHACLCTSGFGTIFCGTIYVVINRPGGPFMLVIANWSACLGRTRTIYVLPGPFMSMHKWSGRTKYDDKSGPAGPSMLS